jgi:hypothetical protein
LVRAREREKTYYTEDDSGTARRIQTTHLSADEGEWSGTSRRRLASRRRRRRTLPKQTKTTSTTTSTTTTPKKRNRHKWRPRKEVDKHDKDKDECVDGKRTKKRQTYSGRSNKTPTVKDGSSCCNLALSAASKNKQKRATREQGLLYGIGFSYPSTTIIIEYSHGHDFWKVSERFVSNTSSWNMLVRSSRVCSTCSNEWKPAATMMRPIEALRTRIIMGLLQIKNLLLVSLVLDI